MCVGRRFEGIDWRVIRLKDGPITALADAEELPRGQIGELIVRGPVVTTEYVTQVDANARAKIYDAQVPGWHALRPSNGVAESPVVFWHRMGDVGYLDEQDRFWFCGRMSQRIAINSANGSQERTLFTIPCEAIFNRHPDVFRSALVGVGASQNRRAAIVVEPRPGQVPRGKKARQRFVGQLRELAQSSDHTKEIKEILIRKSLPVDVRHNVKINREQLAIWAAKKLR